MTKREKKQERKRERKCFLSPLSPLFCLRYDLQDDDAESRCAFIYIYIIHEYLLHMDMQIMFFHLVPH